MTIKLKHELVPCLCTMCKNITAWQVDYIPVPAFFICDHCRILYEMTLEITVPVRYAKGIRERHRLLWLENKQIRHAHTIASEVIHILYHRLKLKHLYDFLP